MNMAKVVYVNDMTGYHSDSDITKFLLEEGHDDLGAFNLRYLIGADIMSSETSLMLKAYFNNQPYHTPGITITDVFNALMKLVTNDSARNLVATNHPLPRFLNDKIDDELTQETTGFTVAFNTVFGMTFLASSFTLFLINERSTKANHLQFSSGINSFTFWSATFCWDLINYLIPVVCLLITLLGFNIDAFVVKDHILHMALLFILYGSAMLPFMYLCSFLFTVPSSGYVWLTMFNILSGDATLPAVGIMSIPKLNLQDLAKALEWAFLVILPNYCLGQGLEDYYSNYRFKSWKKVGYCPQFDALIDHVTGRDTLYMYARLRGIHKREIPLVVGDIIDALLLSEHDDKQVQGYSGDNKCKLSTAILLVGKPHVIFSDEPTTGMDPVARRCLWTTLSSIREAGRIPIHSMEECEALCTRLVVMVYGQFKCFGSPYHLKNCFGEGYFLIARVATKHDGNIPDVKPLKKFSEQKFPGCVLINIH